MLVSARALLDRQRRTPTREEVVEAISGNLCRCTGYEPIIEAILVRRPREGQRMRGTNGFELRKEIFADERDDDLNEIGKRTRRQDIEGHVTGRSPFYDDHLFDGLLHMRCVRSPHHHARIRRIDTRCGRGGWRAWCASSPPAMCR